MLKHIGAVVLGGALVAACVTPIQYGALSGGHGFGYRDTHNADGSYTILVVGPDPTTAHAFWDRRAGEICNSTDFHKNIFRAEVPIVRVSGYAPSAYPGGYGGSYTQDARGAFYLEGYLHCDSSAELAAAVDAHSATNADASAVAAPPAESASATTATP